jgi:hypothetical protein
MRHMLAITGIWLCGAAVVTCLFAAIRAWSRRIPMHGPLSVKYLTPWSCFFLGAGFAVGTMYSPDAKMRIFYSFAALVQFLAGWKVALRLKQAEQLTDNAS